MKTSKKLLSLLLVLTLLLSVSAPAFAAGGSTKISTKTAEPKDYKVAYLADSMGVGFKLAHFEGNGMGWRQTETNSYPVQFTDYLKGKLSNPNVIPYYMGVTGMRGNELCMLLEPDKYAPYQDIFAKEHIDDYIRTFNDDLIKGEDMSMFPEGAQTVNEAYQRALKEADLIVYDLGINNMGTYMMNRLIYELTGSGTDGFDYSHDSLSLIASQLSPALGKSVEDVRAFNRQMLSPLGEELAGKVDGLVDALTYPYASFLYYFDKSMDYIYKNNKDVDVIVIGMFNPVSGATIKLGSIPINLGEILQNTFSSMNFYITGVNEHRFQYKYADISNGISRFLDEFARPFDEITPMTRNHLLEDFYETLDGNGDDAAAFIGGLVDSFKAEEANNAFEAAPTAIQLDIAEPVEEIEEVKEPVEEIKEVTEPVEEIEEVTEPANEQETGIDAISTEVDFQSEAPILMVGNGGTRISLAEAQNCFVNDEGDNPYIQMAVRKVVGNLSKAAATWTVGVENILDFANQSLVLEAMKDYDNASDAAKDLLFIHLAFLACSGIGVHPDQVGTNQKLAAVECAYNNIFTAAVNVPAKIVEAPIKAAAEIVKSVLVPPTKLLTSVVKGVVNATKSLLVIRW